MAKQRRLDQELLGRVARGLWELDDLPSFRTGVLAQLRKVLACDIAAYNEIGDRPEEVFVVADPIESLQDHSAFDAFAALVHQNPLAAHYADTGDPRALRLSDFISRRDFHNLDLYDLVYKHTGIEHQLAFTVPDQGQLIGITVSRAQHDFDDRELALFEFVRGMVVSAYRNLHDRARLQVVSEAIDRSDSGPLAIVLVEASGLLRPAHERAEQLLRGLFQQAQALDTLRAWARRQRDRGVCTIGGPLCIELGEERLEARYVHGQPGALDAIAIQPLALDASRALDALGLTPRQTAVLELIWKGASNAEVALALCISEHTVRHHLEDIYRRLGVSSRAGATHAVTQALAAGTRHALTSPRFTPAAP